MLMSRKYCSNNSRHKFIFNFPDQNSDSNWCGLKLNTKKKFCPFCDQYVQVFSVHILNEHGAEELVMKNVIRFPTRSKERYRGFTALRQLGLRKSKSKECPVCSGWIPFKSVENHAKYCTARLQNLSHDSVLQNLVLPSIEDANVLEQIENDEVILWYANRMVDSLESDQIRSNLELLSRFVLEIKGIDADIKELKDVYHRDRYYAATVAIEQLGSKKEFKGVNYSALMRSLIKQCSNYLLFKYSSGYNRKEMENVNNFLQKINPDDYTELSDISDIVQVCNKGNELITNITSRSNGEVDCVNGKARKKKWTSEERAAADRLYDIYSETIHRGKYPSLLCLAAYISDNPVLKNRDALKLKYYLSNKKKGRMQ